MTPRGGPRWQHQQGPRLGSSEQLVVRVQQPAPPFSRTRVAGGRATSWGPATRWRQGHRRTRRRRQLQPATQGRSWLVGWRCRDARAAAECLAGWASGAEPPVRTGPTRVVRSCPHQATTPTVTATASRTPGPPSRCQQPRPGAATSEQQRWCWHHPGHTPPGTRGGQSGKRSLQPSVPVPAQRRCCLRPAQTLGAPRPAHLAALSARAAAAQRHPIPRRPRRQALRWACGSWRGPSGRPATRVRPPVLQPPPPPTRTRAGSGPWRGSWAGHHHASPSRTRRPGAGQPGRVHPRTTTHTTSS